MAYFSDAKVGDKVYDYTLQEWGKIIEINNNSEYPIVVRFNSCGEEETYMLDGRELINHKAPILFWDEVKPVTPPDKPFDLCAKLEELKKGLECKGFVVDTQELKIYKLDWYKVLAWSYENREPIMCYFSDDKEDWTRSQKVLSGITADGKYTTSRGVLRWPYCKIADQSIIRKEWLVNVTDEWLSEH
jgi:hypothetical protein